MKVLVIGTGMMAHGVVHDLKKQKDVTYIGIGARGLKKKCAVLNPHPKVHCEKIQDAGKDVTKTLKKYDVAISCVPYNYNLNLAKCAIKAKTHFVDLGGNNTIVKKELALNKAAKKAKVTILPDCGLAPGLVNLITAKTLQDLGGKADEIKIRVGGLPQKPQGPLKYARVFSVHGLINEYREKTEVIRNHKKAYAESLKGIEDITMPRFNRKLEAFHTSGGASTLTTTMRRKVKNLNYKTIRFAGHAHMMNTFKQMGSFEEPLRTKFEAYLNDALPRGEKDLVLVKIEGRRGKQKTVHTIIDRAQKDLTAMMRCTSFPASIIAQMAGRHNLPVGAQAQENVVPLEEFFREIKKRKIKLVQEVCRIS